MRFSLFILGVFSVLICIEKPAEAQNQPWCRRVDARAAALRNDYGLRKSFGRNFGIFAAKRWKPIPRVLEATPGIEPG